MTDRAQLVAGLADVIDSHTFTGELEVDSTAVAEHQLTELVQWIREDPGLLLVIGLIAGGDLYRGDGEGGGYFTRAFYLPK